MNGIFYCDRCPPAVSKLLQATRDQQIESGGIKATRLYTHTADVAATNCKQLAALKGDLHKFPAQDSDTGLTKQLDALCPVASCLELKVGAQVMLAKNIDITRGLVNGARGVVVKFDSATRGFPVVRFASGLEMAVTPEKFLVKMGGGAVAVRRQLPLRLAWAISVHKSQGMTLDCVEISLGRAFEDGQAYVALSRARSLQCMRVTDFQPSCVRAHAAVLEYYRSLRRMRRNFIQ
jgi:ATP-dependent DNA helicase PIF1